jgi:hypothetical protein
LPKKKSIVIKVAAPARGSPTVSLAVYGSERRTLSYKYAVYTLYVDP